MTPEQKAKAQRIIELENARRLSPPHAGKDHLPRMRRSGLFRYAAEIAVHGHEQGDAGRLVATALSQGGAVALLAAGASEDELGLTALREVAARRLPSRGPGGGRTGYVSPSAAAASPLGSCHQAT
jgi:hypothetical protein